MNNLEPGARAQVLLLCFFLVIAIWVFFALFFGAGAEAGVVLWIGYLGLIIWSFQPKTELDGSSKRDQRKLKVFWRDRSNKRRAFWIVSGIVFALFLGVQVQNIVDDAERDNYAAQQDRGDEAIGGTSVSDEVPVNYDTTQTNSSADTDESKASSLGLSSQQSDYASKHSDNLYNISNELFQGVGIVQEECPKESNAYSYCGVHSISNPNILINLVNVVMSNNSYEPSKRFIYKEGVYEGLYSNGDLSVYVDFMEKSLLSKPSFIVTIGFPISP